MPYPPEIIEDVRSLNDIVDVVGSYVPLRPSGGSHFGLCPFHHEKSPSFSVHAERQMFHCFGCGAGGNVISFIMRIENFDFMEALRTLADRVHYLLPQQEQSQAVKEQLKFKERLAEAQVKAARFFYENLQADTAEARAARAYLDERGVHPKTRVKFGLGLSVTEWDKLYDYLRKQDFTEKEITGAGLALPNKKEGFYDRFRGRLMFPILETGGKVVGFGGRIMGEEQPKYLNSPQTPLFDKSRQLYGLNWARKAKSKEIILVEGYMDVISLYQAGFPHVAGVLGTALGAEHARLLKRINCESVLLLLDSDEAGIAATLRAIPLLLAGGLKVRVLQVTEVKDPDEYIKRFGAVRFGQLLQTAQNHVAFRVGLLRNTYDFSKTEQRVAFTQEAATLLASLTSAIEADAYMKEISAMTGISVDAIRAETDRARGNNTLPTRIGLTRRVRTDDEGLNRARGGLLGLLISNTAASRALEASGLLKPEELGDETAAKLLKTAYDCGRINRVMRPAEAVSRFETLEEQQRAAELLRHTTAYDNEAATEKALNDMLIVVKRAWLEQRIWQIQASGENDLNAVNKLSEAGRNLTKQYITMTDG